VRDERADGAVSAGRPAANRAAAEGTPDATYQQAMRAFAGMTRRIRLRRAASRVWDSLWFVPAVYVLVALGLSVGLVRWDEADPIVLTRSVSASSAASALSALGSGMIAFTGFVTSVVLLLVQFGTSEFSPRFAAWFRRDRTLKFALSTFTADSSCSSRSCMAEPASRRARVVTSIPNSVPCQLHSKSGVSLLILVSTPARIA
jgi:hypothetical protein